MNEQRLAITLSLVIHAIFLVSLLTITANVNPHKETFYVNLTQEEALPSISKKETKQITRSKTDHVQNISKPKVMPEVMPKVMPEVKPEVMPKVLEIKQPDGESIANGKPVMAEVQKAENPTPTKGGTESGVKSSTPGASLQGTGETVTSPKFGVAYLNNPKPGYPAFARRMGMEGTVMLKVLVSRQGTALKIEIAHSSGHEILDKAAAETVRNWRFVPARKGNSPMEEWVKVPVAFRLRT
ncbi:MAG: TonB family protein [Smithella sp.]